MPVNETPGRQGPGDRMPTTGISCMKEIIFGVAIVVLILLIHTLSYWDEVLLDQIRQERR